MRLQATGCGLRALAFAALLAACADYEKPKAVVGETVSHDLEKLGEVPEFLLLERAGKAVGRDDLKGKVWVCSFIFTRCQTHCVAMSREMVSLQDEFLDHPDFVIVATTVDPANDTPAALRKFADAYKAKPDRWLFLTGDRDDIRAFAADGLKIGWQPDEPLVHSTRFVLVDKQGRIRGYYELREEGRMDKLRSDIRALLAEQP